MKDCTKNCVKKKDRYRLYLDTIAELSGKAINLSNIHDCFYKEKENFGEGNLEIVKAMSADDFDELVRILQGIHNTAILK